MLNVFGVEYFVLHAFGVEHFVLNAFGVEWVNGQIVEVMNMELYFKMFLKEFLLKDKLLSKSLFRPLNLGITTSYFWKVSKESSLKRDLFLQNFKA